MPASSYSSFYTEKWAAQIRFPVIFHSFVTLVIISFKVEGAINACLACLPRPVIVKQYFIYAGRYCIAIQCCTLLLNFPKLQIDQLDRAEKTPLYEVKLHYFRRTTLVQGK